ncbi:hypothetical protein Pvag_pPag20056 (plasmid) [Pantoea vagans C9-1]|nr:hypothetical protein Pvag_pPag20056 [Pantoea vagans C9-1]
MTPFPVIYSRTPMRQEYEVCTSRPDNMEKC